MEDCTTFRAVTQDGMIAIEVTFNSAADEYAPETISEMCQILESISVNLKMALENPEIRNAAPVGGKES